MLLVDDRLSVLADLCVWAARAGRALVSVTRRGRSRLRRWAGMSSWCGVFPSTRMIDGRIPGCVDAAVVDRAAGDPFHQPISRRRRPTETDQVRPGLGGPR